VTEGDAGTTDAVFTVTLSAPTIAPVTVNYATTDGSASAASDYQSAGGVLVFAPGEVAKSFAVAVNGDTRSEWNETIYVRLSSAVGADVADGLGMAVIMDNDVVSIRIADATLTEGNSGAKNAVFDVTLSDASVRTVTVKYATANGSATAGSDYTGLSGTLSFAPGETSKTVSVAVTGDTLSEANETFLVNLSSPAYATLANAQGLASIVNDDLLGATSYGYTAQAHPFERIDLAPGGAGVATLLTSGDNASVQVSLGGNFNFFGTTYSSLFVSSNGLITFGSGNNSYANTDLGSSPSTRAIAPLWDDWRSTTGNAMVLGKAEDLNGDGVRDRVILEWNRVQGYSSSPSQATFQAILQLNTGASPGKIVFNYPDIDTSNFRTNGGSATVGMKDAGSATSNRLLVSYNNGSGAYVASGKAILIGKPDSGTVAATSSRALSAGDSEASPQIVLPSGANLEIARRASVNGPVATSTPAAVSPATASNAGQTMKRITPAASDSAVKPLSSAKAPASRALGFEQLEAVDRLFALSDAMQSR